MREKLVRLLAVFNEWIDNVGTPAVAGLFTVVVGRLTSGDLEAEFNSAFALYVTAIGAWVAVRMMRVNDERPVSSALQGVFSLVGLLHSLLGFALFMDPALGSEAYGPLGVAGWSSVSILVTSFLASGVIVGSRTAASPLSELDLDLVDEMRSHLGLLVERLASEDQDDAPRMAHDEHGETVDHINLSAREEEAKTKRIVADVIFGTGTD